MRSEMFKEALAKEFVELANPEIELAKEVFAHFGLAFLKFGLVEHALINVLTYWNAIEAVKTGEAKDSASYEAAFDRAFEKAKSLTFGNLAKATLAIQEFADLADRFSEAKRIRNYFAHHFMRDESALFGDEDGCWLLLAKIAEVRRETIALEEAIEQRLYAMCARLKVPLPERSRLEGMVEGYLAEARQNLASGTAKVGWER